MVDRAEGPGEDNVRAMMGLLTWRSRAEMMVSLLPCDARDDDDDDDDDVLIGW